MVLACSAMHGILVGRPQYDDDCSIIMSADGDVGRKGTNSCDCLNKNASEDRKPTATPDNSRKITFAALKTCMSEYTAARSTNCKLFYHGPDIKPVSEGFGST